MVSTSSSPQYDETRHGGLETLPCDDPEAVLGDGLEVVPGDGLETAPGGGPETVPGGGPEIVPCNHPETVPCNHPEATPCNGLEIVIDDSPEAVSGGYSEILPSDGPPIDPKEGVPKVWWRLPLSLGHLHIFTRFVAETENRAAGFWSSQKYLVSAIVVLVVVIAVVAGVAAGILRRKGNGKSDPLSPLPVFLTKSLSFYSLPTNHYLLRNRLHLRRYQPCSPRSLLRRCRHDPTALRTALHRLPVLRHRIRPPVLLRQLHSRRVPPRSR
jgi:hypothetical protein